MNIAAVIDSGYKLLPEKHNNPVKKKQKFWAKSLTIRNFLENWNFIWKNMLKVGYQLKESGTSLGLLPWHGLNKMLSFALLTTTPK